MPKWANGMTPLEMGIIAGFPAPPDVSAADYNDDGIVDTADYAVWRDQMGPLVPPGHVCRWRSRWSELRLKAKGEQVGIAQHEPQSYRFPSQLAQVGV